MEKERGVGRRRGNGAAMMEEEAGLRWDGDADEVGVDFGVVQNPCKVKLGRNALEVCRVINGLSQESLDDATNDLTPALRAMDRLAEEGFTTFQLGNGMGGGRALAERRAGAYLKSAAGAASGSPEVRFLNTLSLRPGVPVTRRAVNDAVERSLRRMGVERLDLVQLCWRDFEDRYFLDALCYLEESEWVSNVGVCGFRAAPLALAQKNGLTIASNLVSSSLITAPVGGEETLRQCKEQGVAIISSGASLGGLAANEWLYRSEPADWKLDTARVDFRQALSDVGAWGSTHKDPWHLYQTELLPELETVARKHGRGLYPADVATAFHLRSSSSNKKTDNNGNTMMSDGPTSTASSPCTQNEVAAIVVPVRVCCEGKASIKAAEEEEAKTVGRRGAELAAMLDEEDLERLALAVGKGSVMREEASAGRLCWEEALLGGEGEDRDEEEEGERGGLGWDAPLLFL